MAIRGEEIWVVVDPQFGKQLHTVLHARALWMLETKANRLAAEEYWGQLRDNKTDNIGRHAPTVTLFTAPSSFSPTEQVAYILDTVIEHHPSANTLVIRGFVELGELEAAVATEGFSVDEVAEALIVCKRSTACPNA